MHNILQTGILRCLLLLLVFTATLLTACRQKSHGSPAGYDLHKPQKRDFSKLLNEISGLHFDKESQSLLAISDSKDKIFQIDLKTQKLKDYANNFAPQADFEDIVKVGKTVYVLVSDGTLLAVPPGAKDSSRTKAYKFWLPGKNDFESLYHDPALNGLVILCKSCEQEKGKGIRTAYRFDLDSLRFDSTALYSIALDSLKTQLKTEDVSFKPSAASINPVDSLLYILGSSGKILVIADRRGKLLHAYNLNPDRHPQAEGITFGPNGTMFISNEGKYGKATLQYYFYTPRKQTKPK